MYFLLNQLYLHGQILLFMLINMICIPIRQEKIKKLLDVFGNVSRSFLSFVKESFFAHAPLGLFISFARTKETKQRRVVEDSVRKKFAVCTFLPTPILFYTKQKELAVAQTSLAQAARALHFFARTKKRSKKIRRLHFFAYSGTFLR